MARARVSHCVFDMDGLLLDTERLYSLAQQRVCDRFGKVFTSEVKAAMMGKRSLESAQAFVRGMGLEGQIAPEEFLAERDAHLHQMFPTAALMPGVQRLLEHLHASKVPCCIATSSNRRHFELKTQRHRESFDRIFDHVVTGDDVSQGKPHPEIFLSAAAIFASKPRPEECLVFEDAENGIAAAEAGGFPTVFVPTLDPVEGSIAPEGTPSECIRSLEEFNPETWGLPPFSCSPSH